MKIEWKEPDVEGLVQFLVTEKGFKYVCSCSAFFLILITMCSEERVRKGAEKLAKYINAKQQGRLDGFFTPLLRGPVKLTDLKLMKRPKGKGDAKDAKGTKRKVSIEGTLLSGSVLIRCVIGGRFGE